MNEMERTALLERIGGLELALASTLEKSAEKDIEIKNLEHDLGVAIGQVLMLQADRTFDIDIDTMAH